VRAAGSRPAAEAEFKAINPFTIFLMFRLPLPAEPFVRFTLNQYSHGALSTARATLHHRAAEPSVQRPGIDPFDGRLASRAARLRSQAASSLRSRSAKITRSRPASLSAGAM